MTDITELAQSLKAAAEKWQEALGKYDKVEITIAEFIRAANQYESIVKDPANILALVEALEKAQGMEAYWKTQCRGITDHCEELQARIAELESRTVKLPTTRLWAGVTECYEKSDVIAAILAAGVEVSDD